MVNVRAKDSAVRLLLDMQKEYRVNCAYATINATFVNYFFSVAFAMAS